MRILYEIDFTVSQLEQIIKHLKISTSIIEDYTFSVYKTIVTIKFLYKGNKTYWEMIVRENCIDSGLIIKNIKYLKKGEYE